MTFTSFLTHLRSGFRAIRQSETALINSGRVLINSQMSLTSTNVNDYEFKIFSQWGEDGIIQYLTRSIDIENHTFIEFGIEDFCESNCRFLMMKDFWHGFVIDGSKKNIDTLRSSYFFFQYELNSCCSFIDRNNINGLIEASGFSKFPGIISIDLDGVDFHIFEAMKDWRPSIYIFEYNSNFGKEAPVTVPYDPAFVRRAKHWSNQYWGASLPAFDHLAKSRGYSIVGVNSAGSNAFYVRDDLLNDRVKPTTVDACFRNMSFRDSRDRTGKLTFADASTRLDLMANMPLVNVVTGEQICVSDLPKLGVG
jgi:hypothetical protein